MKFHNFQRKNSTFYNKSLCVCLLYAIPIYYLYLYVFVSRMWYVYACVHASSMVYVYIYFCFTCLLYLHYDWLLILCLQLFIFLLRKTGACGIVQVCSDARCLIVSYKHLNLTNDLYDLNCVWLLVG